MYVTPSRNLGSVSAFEIEVALYESARVSVTMFIVARCFIVRAKRSSVSFGRIRNITSSRCNQPKSASSAPVFSASVATLTAFSSSLARISNIFRSTATCKAASLAGWQFLESAITSLIRIEIPTSAHPTLWMTSLGVSRTAASL